MKIIQENEYLDTMKNEVEPYLKAHCRDGYIPGAEDIYHEKNGIIGKIHVKRYLLNDTSEYFYTFEVLSVKYLAYF